MVDKARIYVKAGDGGNGVVHFLREKFRPKGGPDGGNGGRGGDVYLETNADLATLEEFAFKQKFLAQNGENGAGRKSSGANGSDLVIKLPVGTVVNYILADGTVTSLDLDKPGTRYLLARGGKGGKGNWHFRSSTNVTPQESEPGVEGEDFELDLELRLLADVGLIGLPNVGKSMLLSVLTQARPKVADYPFTTLEPNLGVLKVSVKKSQSGMGKGVVIADIPGLIEKASEGKGLGDDFLRHISRTKLLVHVLSPRVDLLDDDKGLFDYLYSCYGVVRNELSVYGLGVADKQELVLLNKVDLLSNNRVTVLIKMFKAKKIKIEPVSAYTLMGIGELKKKLYELCRK